MPAGLNRLAELTTFSYPSDDQVGGAVPSGTVVYSNLILRISSEEPTQVLLEQGIQTPEIFSAHLFPGNVNIKHNDQIRVTSPAGDWFYNKRFRVIGIQRSSNSPYQDRNFIRITLRRYDESHAESYQ